MSYPVPYYVAPARRATRPVQQAIAYQDAVAFAEARRIQHIAFVTKVAMFEVAGIGALEAELTKQSPLAGQRLEAIGNTAAVLIAGEIGRFAGGL